MLLRRRLGLVHAHFSHNAIPYKLRHLNPEPCQRQAYRAKNSTAYCPGPPGRGVVAPAALALGGGEGELAVVEAGLPIGVAG